MYKKILILRFSSIGDIVLASPVLRALKHQLPDTKLHFVCKDVFSETMVHNPNIDQLHTFKKDIDELFEVLKHEKFDLIIDLHNNLRSRRLKNKLKVKTLHFPKINWQKFLAVNFKKIGVLPNRHVVDRYFEALEQIGVKPDGKGLDYFISAKDYIDTAALFKQSSPVKFMALVLGGSYATKQMPLQKLSEICSNAKLPIVLLGGKTDQSLANELHKQFNHTVNLCGTLSLNQSASVIQQAEWVISGDTGLMHIASAYHKKIVSVWGNTIPEFGMSPYMPHAENKILQVKNLSCRPCSKLGYHNCPLGHFECMNKHSFAFIEDLV